MTLPAFEFRRRFLQHVLPRGLHKVRHYGFLSRRSTTNLHDVRTAILQTLADIEPDLELEMWRVPTLCSVKNDGTTCPDCGGRLMFECFTRHGKRLTTGWDLEADKELNLNNIRQVA